MHRHTYWTGFCECVRACLLCECVSMSVVSDCVRECICFYLKKCLYDVCYYIHLLRLVYFSFFFSVLFVVVAVVNVVCFCLHWFIAVLQFCLTTCLLSCFTDTFSTAQHGVFPKLFKGVEDVFLGGGRIRGLWGSLRGSALQSSKHPRHCSPAHS